MSRTSRWTALVLLGVGTYGTAFLDMTQARATPGQDLPAGTRTTVQHGPPPPVPDPVANRAANIAQLDAKFRDPKSGIVGSGSLLRFDVTAVPAGVRVFTEVGLMDRRESNYVWRLRVYDAAVRDRPLLDRPYPQQAFTVPTGRRDPTFEETIPLPPGTYRVMVTLYEFHSKTRPDRLFAGDPDALEDQAILGGVKTITVGK